MNLSKYRIEWIRGEGSCEKSEWLAICSMALRTEELEQELSRLRACVVLTPEQAGQLVKVLRAAMNPTGPSEMQLERIQAALALLSTPQPPKEQG